MRPVDEFRRRGEASLNNQVCIPFCFEFQFVHRDSPFWCGGNVARTLVQPVIVLLEGFSEHREPAVHGFNARLYRDDGGVCSSTRRTISPASSSTLRCWEIAGCVMSKGSANSLTVGSSPLARRARIARLVGSAKAEKAESRSLLHSYSSLYKVMTIVKKGPDHCPQSQEEGCCHNLFLGDSGLHRSSGC